MCREANQERSEGVYTTTVYNEKGQKEDSLEVLAETFPRAEELIKEAILSFYEAATEGYSNLKDEASSFWENFYSSLTESDFTEETFLKEVREKIITAQERYIRELQKLLEDIDFEKLSEAVSEKNIKKLLDAVEKEDLVEFGKAITEIKVESSVELWDTLVNADKKDVESILVAELASSWGFLKGLLLGLVDTVKFIWEVAAWIFKHSLFYFIVNPEGFREAILKDIEALDALVRLKSAIDEWIGRHTLDFLIKDPQGFKKQLQADMEAAQKILDWAKSRTDEDWGRFCGVIVFEIIIGILTDGIYTASRATAYGVKTANKTADAGKILREVAEEIKPPKAVDEAVEGLPVNKKNTNIADEATGKKVTKGTDNLSKVGSRIEKLELSNLRNKIDELDEAAQGRLGDDIVRLTNDQLRELDDNFGLIDQWQKYDNLEQAGKNSNKPEWRKNIDKGIEFNKIREKSYPYNEVYLMDPRAPKGSKKKVRMDSYIKDEEIVSRKHTQFSEIKEETGIKYVKELKDKYPPGAIIADVPTNRLGGKNGGLREKIGEEINGQMILEVPPQKHSIPQGVIDKANKNGIIIRDFLGKKYN